jgi:hypothetical protein
VEELNSLNIFLHNAMIEKQLEGNSVDNYSNLKAKIRYSSPTIFDRAMIEKHIEGNSIHNYSNLKSKIRYSSPTIFDRTPWLVGQFSKLPETDYMD